MGLQTTHIAVLVCGAAAIGFLLGRLIRGRAPAIESGRPRLAISSAYLRDAHNASLSLHTRLRCAFDAIYFCCFELACADDAQADALTHPSAELVRTSLAATEAATEDRRIAETLADWAVSTATSLPNVSIKAACAAAERIHIAAVSSLSTR
ncbi:hypothetical protein [Paraburkholderia phenazinium]|uniref:hypothetical protein n=1 Tax=Paraburkholderia phenazinium TaxID=60549 RepID=UPI00158E07FC|nr:hypothetical protein [Paraburkholderia phenazinium]